MIKSTPGRIIFALGALLLTGFVLTYIMIPASLTVATVRTVGTSMTAAVRCLKADSIWQHRFTCSGKAFHITKRMPNALQLAGKSSLVPNPTNLLLIQSHPDSILIKWESRYQAGWNPVLRITNYQKAVKFKACSETILNDTRNFLEQNENIYGFGISRTTLTDSFLVSMQFHSAVYPSVDDIYSRIDSIRKFISAQGASETNPPMMNVRKDNHGALTVMVGIAINKFLNSSGRFSIKRVAQYKNRTLITEVRGDNTAIGRAMDAIHQYMDDYRFTNPTTYFEMLVTDRRKEKDPSKWITRIYYPIV